MLFRTFSARSLFYVLTRGDALRSAQRLPLAIISSAVGALAMRFALALAIISRAVGALAMRFALAPGYHISRRWRSDS